MTGDEITNFRLNYCARHLPGRDGVRSGPGLSGLIMPSRLVKTGDSVAIICTGRTVQPRCFYCGKPSGYLCDFPVLIKGKKKTCDRKLCEGCRRSGISKDIDFCREHFPLAKAAYERRKAKETNF
jgi:hypothetical protein